MPGAHAILGSNPSGPTTTLRLEIQKIGEKSNSQKKRF
jgi:hypothetical protein